MNRLFILVILISCWRTNLVLCQSQQPPTPYHASFQLTYDRTTEEYTFWLVPNYSTPNQFNTNQEESNVAVGVTLMVPKEFTIVSYTGLVANWNTLGNELKLGPGLPGQDLWPLDQIPLNVQYYSLGIAGFGTYAPFTSGMPIPSFRFKGNGCFGDIRMLEKEDPITKVALDSPYQLNIENYFLGNSASKANARLENHYLNNISLGASCFVQTELTARSDTFQVAANSTTAQFNVLANDDKNRLPVIVRDSKLRVLSSPAHGSLSITQDNQIQYQTNLENVPSFSFQYEVCLVSEPTQCDTATVVVRGSGPPSIRILQCNTEETILSVPAEWGDVNWFRNDFYVAFGPTLTVRESGQYSVQSPNQTCPADGCLQIIVITEVCCPDIIRIPTQARKVRRR